MGPIMNCIDNIGFVIIAAFGGYFSVTGRISVGVISAFIVYAKQFSRPINEIAQVYGQLQTAIAGVERVFTVLDEADKNKAGVEFAKEEKATVTFKNVCFSYDSKNPVIKNFSLTIPTSKKVALVGATGSGKTTIVNLLMRFYAIDRGEIYINKQNIQDIARKHLRQNIAIVLQDTVLAGSGANISQGQRQLLAIARAFVANPKILILDEATSSVDTRTEKAIQDAMQHIMQERTSIVIAHRPSTIRDSNLIVVMEHGEIVESGNHETLLAQKGKYHDLYMTQYARFAT